MSEGPTLTPCCALPGGARVLGPCCTFQATLVALTPGHLHHGPGLPMGLCGSLLPVHPPKDRPGMSTSWPEGWARGYGFQGAGTTQVNSLGAHRWCPACTGAPLLCGVYLASEGKAGCAGSPGTTSPQN